MAGTLAHFEVMRRYLSTYEGVTLNGDYTFKIEDLEDRIIAPEWPLFRKDVESEWSLYRKETEKDIYSIAILGSTGPDLFYMPAILSKLHIFYNYSVFSDYMHYKNAGLFVKNLYETRKEEKNEKLKKNIEYLCKGFLSHMATDLVYHPFVNSFVGKYKEHIITEVDVPGASFLVDGNFAAHNMIEMAQDYYILTELWKGTDLNIGHNMILTNRIKDHIPSLARSLFTAIENTYDVKSDFISIQNYLTYFVANAQGSTFEEYPDTVLDDKFNYQPAIEHIMGGASIEFFLEKSMELTKLMIDKMIEGDWEDILKPWNLDTGLYTEAKVEENEIKINFKNYDSVWNVPTPKSKEEKEAEDIALEMYSHSPDTYKDTGIETI